MQFVTDNTLNEFFDGDLTDIGIIMQGGMYNTTLRSFEFIGLADAFGDSSHSALRAERDLSADRPEVVRFAQGKRAILVVEEGQPEFIEQAINTIFGAPTCRPRSKARACCRWPESTPAVWCATG